jgi:hypothetical protein
MGSVDVGHVAVAVLGADVVDRSAQAVTNASCSYNEGCDFAVGDCVVIFAGNVDADFLLNDE